jgi:hypothetical protein
MTKTKLGISVALAMSLGILAAIVVAPSLYPGPPSPDAMQATWADQYVTLREMASDVDAIVLATVQATQPGRQIITGSGSVLPFTLVNLQVARSIRGNLGEGEVFTLEQTGGDVGDRSFSIQGDGGPYTPGAQVLLFLKQQPETDYFYLVNPQGRFSVQQGQLMAADPEDPVSQRLDLRNLDNAINLIKNEIGSGR